MQVLERKGTQFVWETLNSFKCWSMIERIRWGKSEEVEVVKHQGPESTVDP